jgi:hypothetical protein
MIIRVAPALGTALAYATGIRLHSLPLGTTGRSRAKWAFQQVIKHADELLHRQTAPRAYPRQ